MPTAPKLIEAFLRPSAAQFAAGKADFARLNLSSFHDLFKLVGVLIGGDMVSGDWDFEIPQIPICPQIIRVRPISFHSGTEM